MAPQANWRVGKANWQEATSSATGVSYSLVRLYLQLLTEASRLGNLCEHHSLSDLSSIVSLRASRMSMSHEHTPLSAEHFQLIFSRILSGDHEQSPYSLAVQWSPERKADCSAERGV
eukprot:COSAG01_NODE_333_length_18717_cov_40.372072_9_plen_117_part_00